MKKREVNNLTEEEEKTVRQTHQSICVPEIIFVTLKNNLPTSPIYTITSKPHIINSIAYSWIV